MRRGYKRLPNSKELAQLSFHLIPNNGISIFP